MAGALKEVLSKAREKLSSPLSSPRSSPRTSTEGGVIVDAKAYTSIDSDRSGVSVFSPQSMSSSDEPLTTESLPLTKNQRKKRERRRQRELRRRRNEVRIKHISIERRQRDEEARKLEPLWMQKRYGSLPMLSSAEESLIARQKIEDMTADNIGQDVVFRARIHALRKMSSKFIFIVFRQQVSTMQAVLEINMSSVSGQMVRWARGLATGTVVIIGGTIVAPKVVVKGCTIHCAEIVIKELHVIAARTGPVAFSVQECEVRNLHSNEGDRRAQRISLRTRLANRVIDLRTSPSQAIFRINSAVGQLFRTFLISRGFIEVHTPKLQGGVTEGGASVFEVKYFGRPAFLAQSPQLAKQMCISADFERVFEIGPVFRAENSNTHRHLTEYTGLDLEMAIEHDYHEALEVIDATLKYIFQGVYENHRRELDIIKSFYPAHEDLVWLDETLVLPFHEGIRLLFDSGWVDEEGRPPSGYEDLSTKAEIRLGQLVKEKYHTDYYILDKFPASARPFYTMPDANDPKITNSFDIFLRGQEILSGGQRIHDADLLEENIKRQGMDPKSLEEYLEAFRWGMPRHAGGGIGLERLVMQLLALDDIRAASLFPRDPKSFPPQLPPPKLRHPEASTLHPPWQDTAGIPVQKQQLQPLEKLIANYGNSTNTSWFDERVQIWRDRICGAAIGYVQVHRYALMPGDPLCDDTQYVAVIRRFLKWLRAETKLKPVWLLTSQELETALGTSLGWKTFSCAAEQVADPAKNAANEDGDIARKIRHAQREGIKIVEIPAGETVPDGIRKMCDVQIQNWLNKRQGAQVRLSTITPWVDQEHRRFFYAQDKDGTIRSLVILAQLSVKNGWQVKWALDFPGAPNGTIEYITIHAMNTIAGEGTHTITFGGGASSKLIPGHNMTGVKIKILEKSYRQIAQQLHLTRKSEFRAKLGAHDYPIYICYPPGGLGPHGIKAILEFFEG